MRVGMHDGADGAYHNLPGISGYPTGHVFMARMEAEAEAGRALSPAQGDRAQRDQALDYLVEEPGAAAAILARKLHLFFSNVEAKGNDYWPRVRASSTLLSWLPGSFGARLVLAAAGAGVLWTQRKRWELALCVGVIGCVLAANLISFVTWRYRIHALVPLFVLAGPALVWLIRIPRQLASGRLPRGRRTWIAAGAFTALPLAPGLVAYWPVAPEVVDMMAAKAEGNRGKSLDGERMQARLAELAPRVDTDIVAAQETVFALARLQRHRESYRLLARVISGGSPWAAGNAVWIRYLAWRGRAAEAAGVLQSLHARDPALEQGFGYSGQYLRVRNSASENGLSSETRGRLNDGTTPSRCVVASIVEPFMGPPLSACRTQPLRSALSRIATPLTRSSSDAAFSADSV